MAADATGFGAGAAGADGLALAAGLAAGFAGAFVTGLGSAAPSTLGSFGLAALRVVVLSGANASASANLRAISQWRSSWPSGLFSDSQI